MNNTNLNQVGPPQWPWRLVRRFLNPYFHEELEGDLEERFQDNLKKYGLRRARLLFVSGAFKLLRPSLMRKLSGDLRLNQYGMLRHHFLFAIRGFKRFKTSFAINVLGLSSSLVCALLIALWVEDEWKMDRFHDKTDTLYQVKQNVNHTGTVETINPTPALLGQALLEELPDVLEAASVVPPHWYGSDGILQYGDKQYKTIEQYASKEFFNVFSFPLIRGDADQVLAAKQNVVISESYADRIFGEEIDPVGQPIIWMKDDTTLTYQVSGVFERIPVHASEPFDVVFTLETFLDQYPHIRKWGNSDPSTYVVLSEQADVAALDEQIRNFVATKKDDYPYTLFLQKFSDTYLYNQYENGLPMPGRVQYVKLFTLVAILVLIIACINFMNLTTARASRRLKEIGLKKTMGLKRGSLAIQFFVEAFLISLVAFVLALGLIAFILPEFNTFSGKHLQLRLDWVFMILSMGLLVFTTLLAGSYPALYLSGLKPINSLRGVISNSMGDIWTRKGLVVFQFAISLALITSVLVVSSQVSFIQNKDLGFEKEHVIYFNADGQLVNRAETFVAALRNETGVTYASLFGHDLLGGRGSTTGLKWEGKDPEARIRFGNLEVGYDLIETFGMELLEGRTFSPDFGDEQSKILFNETAIKAMGLADPLGQTITLWGKDREIIGVVKDFHFESLHKEILPCFFQYAPRSSTVVVRLVPGAQAQTLERIEALYNEYNPGLPFDFHFFDQEYDALYKSEQQVAGLST
ncbi:MAG: ABC transporter permease, partial [Bacteroidota bacterium]